jgi:hypothetical protein
VIDAIMPERRLIPLETPRSVTLFAGNAFHDRRITVDRSGGPNVSLTRIFCPESAPPGLGRFPKDDTIRESSNQVGALTFSVSAKRARWKRRDAKKGPARLNYGAAKSSIITGMSLHLGINKSLFLGILTFCH